MYVFSVRLFDADLPLLPLRGGSVYCRSKYRWFLSAKLEFLGFSGMRNSLQIKPIYFCVWSLEMLYSYLALRLLCTFFCVINKITIAFNQKKKEKGRFCFSKVKLNVLKS